MSASSSTIFNRAVGLAPRAPLYRCSRPLATSVVRPASATMARSIHSSAPRANATPAVSNEQVKNLEFEKLKKTYVMDHHLYKPTDLDAVTILHHKPQGLSDRVAWILVKTMRSIFDMATRYPSKKSQFATPESQQAAKTDMVAVGHGLEETENATTSQSRPKEGDVQVMTLQEQRQKGLAFSPDQWLTRFVFLESVAGVPGMVCGILRHLHSLRRLSRDRGWIATCLEDAENERMHLLTFLKMANPGLLMRTLLIATQGIFFNFLFIAYVLSPRTVHRFVGILEEEAVKTYTVALTELREGRLPEWEALAAPNIAKEYWKLPQDAKMIDVLKVIRADEASHRFIHHTFANLDQSGDTNPFSVALPTPLMIGTKLNLSREEALQFIEKAKQEAKESIEKASHGRQMA